MLRHRILGKLALRPSRDPLDPGIQSQFTIKTNVGELEIYRQTVHGEKTSDQSPQLIVLKWPGNAGRAENSTRHPADAWPDRVIEIWTINPHGYGQSQGNASLRNVPTMAQSVWQHAQQSFPDIPKLIFGTSIGCITAIYQTTLAQSDSSLRGLLLRNPPPLQQLIRGHYHHWSYGPFTRWITNIIHGPLDSVFQATKCRTPMLMLQAENDSIVPAIYQNLIFDAYAGKKTKFVIPDAEHNEMPIEELQTRYLDSLRNSFHEIARNATQP